MKTFHRFLVLALVALCGSACDGRLITATAPFDRTFEFTFDSNDGTTAVATLTESDILGELDLPEDGYIERVDIERVRLSLAPGSANEANTATLTFTYAAGGFTEGLDITLTNIDQEPVDALVESTLRVLESDVLGVLTGTGPFSITVQGDVTDIASTGSRLVLDADLAVKLTVTYVFCEDLGWGPFGPGADCITPENPIFSN